MDKLPALPELPLPLRDVPFLHKSYVYEQSRNAGSPIFEAETLSELDSHKRHEHLGDAVLKIMVAGWVFRHFRVDSGIASVGFFSPHYTNARPSRERRFTDAANLHLQAQHIEGMLLSNATLLRIAKGYGWEDKLKVGTRFASTSSTDKILADCFEAYLGVLWLEILSGRMSITTLEAYFGRLFSEEVFPDLHVRAGEWQAARIAKRRRSQQRLEAKVAQGPSAAKDASSS